PGDGRLSGVPVRASRGSRLLAAPALASPPDHRRRGGGRRDVVDRRGGGVASKRRVGSDRDVVAAAVPVPGRTRLSARTRAVQSPSRPRRDARRAFDTAGGISNQVLGRRGSRRGHSSAGGGDLRRGLWILRG